MASLALGVKFIPASSGTGDFVYSTTVGGYRGSSALVDGKTYRYRAENTTLTEWEYGTGVWSSSTSTLTRATVSFSSTGSKVSFTSTPTVGIIQFVEDVLQFDDAMSLTGSQKTRGQINLGVREVLTSNRTYYVRTDGSDSNNGLSNSAGGAFLTIQKAANVVGALDASIYNVTISIGAGAFSEDVKLPAVLGSGVYTLTGAGVASTTIKSIEFLPRSTWKYNNVKVSGGDSLIILGAFANVRANGPTEYGTATVDHIRMVDAMASWIAESNYTISGGAERHWRIDDGGVIFVYGRTVTLTGTPNFSDRFARAVFGSKIIAGSMTFSGSATGSRYIVSTNGTIGTDGGGANYLPGNAAGYADTGSGGIYT